MEAALGDTDSGLAGLVDRRAARAVWDRFRDGGPDESPLLWTLLCLDLWERSTRDVRPRFELLEGVRPAAPAAAAGGAG